LEKNFFDSNFLIYDRAQLPSGLPESPRWITETVRSEVRALLPPAEAEKRLGVFDALTFDEIYALDPGICPVYYSYVVSMFSPANLGSEEFFEDLYVAKARRGETISSEEEEALNFLRNRSSRSKAVLPGGISKPADYKRLEAMTAKSRKKIRAAARDRHRNEMNDARSMALMIYHALRTMTNVNFYTADGDTFDLMLKWLDSMAMHSTMVSAISSQMTPQKYAQLLADRKLQLRFKYADFLHAKHARHRALARRNPTEPAVRFTIKHWNLKEMQFGSDEGFALTGADAAFLSQMHVDRWCYFSPNMSQGNWFRYQYPGPPADPSADLVVDVFPKTFVKAQAGEALHTHNHVCQYRRDDAANNVSRFSSFVAPSAPGTSTREP
jgi:hypothetical protein